MGDRLRKWRLDRSPLQSEIAERLGVDQSTITNSELNRTAPALHLLPRILVLINFEPTPSATKGGQAIFGLTH
jgi:transcriptional regulator with XRE-family HTH domain